VDNTTARLVDYALAASFDTLSDDTIHHCKRRLIDTYGCAMGAYNEPVCRIARDMASRCGGSGGEATIWGSGTHSIAEMAAFANGVMLRFLDISDTYQGKGRGHPSDVMSGILAVGEAVRADGPSVITALALAYDLYCSFEEAIDINARGWDHTVYGVVACALGAAKLLNMPREQMANTLGLALAPNVALMASRKGELSNWKGCAGANASRNAVFAALLAQRGLSGPGETFEGKGGVWETLGERFDWNPPTRGTAPMITRTDLKSLPICYHGQSAVLASFALRKDLLVADIDTIQVDTYSVAIQMMAEDRGRWAPTTHESADHSLPYVVARAFLDGKVDTASFSAAQLCDPAVVALMNRISVREDEALTRLYPQGAPARLAVQLKSGEQLTFEIEHPLGHSKNPMNDEQLEEKFRRLLSGVGRSHQNDAVLDLLWKFEQAGDVKRDIFEPLAALERARPATV